VISAYVVENLGK